MGDQVEATLMWALKGLDRPRWWERTFYVEAKTWILKVCNLLGLVGKVQVFLLPTYSQNEGLVIIFKDV